MSASEEEASLSFPERAAKVLATTDVKQTIGRGTSLVAEGRRLRFKDLGPAGDAYRRRARAIRESALARLPELVSTLSDRLEARGAHVHFAGDADEACQIVAELAQKRNARSAVKMKSMLTEELHLRERLEDAGVAATETDLGEWIIQLAREAPSHIIAPALHKPRQAVKALFDERLGPDPREDAESLVARARLFLRERFLEADIGITGVNFAVAESGTLILVSNEGNGRLTTSCPPVHVALVPLEKLVATLDESLTLVRMLVHSATGQRLTTYVSFVCGPRGREERDGPEELHVVLVDNGRAAAIEGPLADALLCLRCGACLNVCPVFQRVGGQTYGSVYSGPIGIPVTAIVGEERCDLPHASTLCGACAEVCPVHIDLPRLILETRRQNVRAKRTPLLERMAARGFEAAARRPWLFRLAQTAVRWAARLGLLPSGSMGDLPGPTETFRDRFRRRHAS